MTQKPDNATAQDSGGGFTPHSDGQHGVICADVVNLGMKLESYQDTPPYESPKVCLVFVSGERQEEDNSLVVVTTEMTLSASDKANLRKFLEAWRGKSYSDEQVEEGLPLHKLQGQAGLISVEHVLTKKKRKFAKIVSIAPLPKGMPQPAKELLAEYTRPKFLEDRKAEYAKQVAKYRVESGVKDDLPAESGEELDPLPFD